MIILNLAKKQQFFKKKNVSGIHCYLNGECHLQGSLILLKGINFEILGGESVIWKIQKHWQTNIY